jgi:hypothetical protein
MFAGTTVKVKVSKSVMLVPFDVNVIGTADSPDETVTVTGELGVR